MASVAVKAHVAHIEPAAVARPQVLPSFDVLYDEHSPYIWRVLRRLGVDEASAEDAMQDVFMIAVRRQADFEGRSSPRTWLYGIAVRIARKRRALRARAAEPFTECAGEARYEPGQQAERNQAIALVEEALERLAPERREVFVLADVEELPAPEIADALGIPMNTVYSRLRVARQEFDAAAKRLRSRDEWRLR